MKSNHITSRVFIFTLFLFLSKVLIAQDYKIGLEGITKVKITSETTIIVKTHSIDSLIIKENENYRSSIPQKSKGLKPITSIGEDNTSYGVHISNEESVLVLTGLRDRTASNLVVTLPNTMNISLEITHHNDIYVFHMNSEVEAKIYNGDMYFQNVTGPIIAENTVGEINVVFDSLNQSSPMSIVSINGNIDVSLPEDAKVNLTAKVPRGEFYTDFEINIVDDFEGRIARAIKTQLNSGGVEMSLHTLKGNIYLRKTE